MTYLEFVCDIKRAKSDENYKIDLEKINIAQTYSENAIRRT